MVWILNTIHLGLAMHIPWYYLVDGAGGTHNDVVVWSWPASIIVTVRVLLPKLTVSLSCRSHLRFSSPCPCMRAYFLHVPCMP
jgi:hypothetical protein